MVQGPLEPPPKAPGSYGEEMPRRKPAVTGSESGPGTRAEFRWKHGLQKFALS